MRYFFCFVFGNPGGVLAARSRPVFRTGDTFPQLVVVWNKKSGYFLKE